MHNKIKTEQNVEFSKITMQRFKLKNKDIFIYVYVYFVSTMLHYLILVCKSRPYSETLKLSIVNEKIKFDKKENSSFKSFIVF